jgi:hypothetical protein
MNYLKIRFITEKDFVSMAIRGVTYSQWSHAEIELPDGSFLGAHAKGGVQIRKPDYCKPTRDRRYAVPVADDAAYANMLKFANDQLGKGYDFKAIAGLVCHQAWNNATEWFCSELVAAIAYAGNMSMLNVEREFVTLITPEMLHLSPLLIVTSYYSVG